jgi:hypothetical protein
MLYYQDGLKEGGFESGVRGVTGILSSPFFLYRGGAFQQT